MGAIPNDTFNSVVLLFSTINVRGGDENILFMSWCDLANRSFTLQVNIK
jgi:hypothetical protein